MELLPGTVTSGLRILGTPLPPPPPDAFSGLQCINLYAHTTPYLRRQRSGKCIQTVAVCQSSLTQSFTVARLQGLC